MPILKPNEIFANRYRLIRNIGAGGYSEVWLAADQMAGDLEIALKVYAPGQGLDDQAIQIFRGEYKGVFYLNHPNLLKPTHFDIFDGRPYLILPFCAKGSIMKMTGQIEEVSIARMLKQIGGALDYLHSQNSPIIHRDIKPENILVDDADYYYLCDFGISSKLRRTLTKSMGRGQESSGTVAFMAPELFQAKRQILPESDIFSFGVMIYELITDELPFGQIGGAMLMNGAQVPDMSEFCSLGLAQIISKCLNLDPQQRPTGAELKRYGDTFLKTGNWILNEKVGRKTEIQPVFNVKNKNRGANDYLNSPFGNAKIKKVKDYMRSNLVSLLSIILRLFNKNSDLDQQNLNKIGKYSSYFIFAIISYILFNYSVFENMTFLKGLFAIGFGLVFCKILIYNLRNFKFGLIISSNQLDRFRSKSRTITSWSLIGIGILYSMSISDFKTYYYDYWIVLFLLISMIGVSVLLINFVKKVSNSHNNDQVLINNSKIYLNLFFVFLGFGFVRIADWLLGIIIGDSVISFSIFAPFWQGTVLMPNIVLLILLSTLSSLLYSLYFKVFFNVKNIFILFFTLFGLAELFFQVLNKTFYYYVKGGIIESSFWHYSIFPIEELIFSCFIVGLFLFFNMINFKNALKKYSLFVLLTSATLLIQTWLLWRGSTDLEISNFIYSISKIIEFGIIGLVAFVSLKSFGGLKNLINIEEPKRKIIPPFKINKKLIFILSGIISFILIVLVLFWQISIYNSKTETKTKTEVSSQIDKNRDAEKKFNLAIDKYQESISAFTDAEKNQTNDYDKAVRLMIESTNLLVDSYNEFSDEYKTKATAQINANKNEIELRIKNELQGVELCPDKKCKDDYSSKISQLKRYESEVKSNSNVDNSENVQNGNTSFVFDYDMVYVQGGIFQMGSNDGNEDEKPVHTVGLGGFYIGKTEVTQAQWRAVMGNNPSSFKGDNLPVETVSWNMVQTFIEKLNQLTGKQYRLPTEAEWEYAARGGNKSKGYQYAGSNNLGNVAWHSDNSGSKTHVVASKQPNELGLFDMSGNVGEWCSDWYGNYFTTAQTNPNGASSGSYRVFRGGSWYCHAYRCRTAYRRDDTPDFRNHFMGFRLVSPN